MAVTSFTPFLRRKSHGRLAIPADDLTTCSVQGAVRTCRKWDAEMWRSVARGNTSAPTRNLGQLMWEVGGHAEALLEPSHFTQGNFLAPKFIQPLLSRIWQKRLRKTEVETCSFYYSSWCLPGSRDFKPKATMVRAVLFAFVTTCHEVESSGRREPLLRKYLHQIGLWESL